MRLPPIVDWPQIRRPWATTRPLLADHLLGSVQTEKIFPKRADQGPSRLWNEPLVVSLSPEELERYDRQLGPGVLTPEGQLRLKQATVLITRVGGMGGPAAQMLTMAGVGRLLLAHGGELISPDLNRQVLGSEAGLGLPRAPQFADYLRSLNRFVTIEALAFEPTDEQAEALARRCDLIISSPPTFAERLRLNRAAVAARIPLVDAAQWGMTGTLTVVRPGTTACLACLYPTAPPFETAFPVVGAISCATGALAALEAIKILAQVGSPRWGQLFTYDGFRGQQHTVKLQRNPDCPCCGGLIDQQGERT